MVGNVVHVLVHVAFLGLLAHLVLQVALLLDPALPFSRPMQQTRSRDSFWLYDRHHPGEPVHPVLLGPDIQQSLSTIAAVAIIVFIGVVIDLLTRARVSRQAQLLEFEG